MHRLTSSFVLGYHGCDLAVGERILKGTAFKQSDNDYYWLGPGVYFWEANPKRALQFASEAQKRKGSAPKPFVVGAIIELGLCLDLTTATSLDWVSSAHQYLVENTRAANLSLPTNSGDQLRRKLDCAVIRHLHLLLDSQDLPSIDTVKGVFIEGAPLYPGSGFLEKTHVQIAVRNPHCIKGVFRVPKHQMSS